MEFNNIELRADKTMNINTHYYSLLGHDCWSFIDCSMEIKHCCIIIYLLLTSGCTTLSLLVSSFVDVDKVESFWVRRRPYLIRPVDADKDYYYY